MNSDLQRDFERFAKEHLDPISKNMVEQERVRLTQDLEKFQEESRLLIHKHHTHISQLITLESIIFGAIIIFTNTEQVTLFLIISIVLILVSLIFGIWSQSLSDKEGFQANQWSYNERLRSSWMIREIWKDPTVKKEREMLESYLKDYMQLFKTTLWQKALTIFRLNADLVDNIFVFSFIISLGFLIFHFVIRAYFLH